MINSTSFDDQDSENIATAAKITVAFLWIYLLTFVNILVTKKTLIRQARQEAMVFDRYTSPGMLNADRLNANILEWSPIFLGPLWSLAMTANLGNLDTLFAWTYVSLRALYFILVLKYGVASDGMNKALWFATYPGYLCLLQLMAKATHVLFL